MRPRSDRSTKPARLRAGFSLLAWLACGGAFAQVVHTAEYLARMDADADGRVSLPEYQDWLSYAFDAMDADHDGLLAPHEQPGGRGRPIAREAHRARLAEAFRRQDANRDGVLTATELAAPPR
jgi:hypothetical protein